MRRRSYCLGFISWLSFSVFVFPSYPVPARVFFLITRKDEVSSAPLMGQTKNSPFLFVRLFFANVLFHRSSPHMLPCWGFWTQLQLFPGVNT